LFWEEEMLSWQAYTLLFIFRVKRNLFDRSGELNVEKDRRELDGMAKIFKPLSPVQCTPVNVNNVPAEWITPVNISTDRVILYIHGGSFNSGSVVSHRPLAANIAIACKARALIIDYRLAPEHPFPCALQDSLAAYEWLLASGIPPERIVLAGDSAGGTLTLALLIQLRDQGEPLPAMAVCISPATDLTMSGESWTRNRTKDVMLDLRNIRISGEIYMGGMDVLSPLVSPLYADLRGLPPLLIQVGSNEVLLSDATRFAEKAKDSGVSVTLEVWNRMQHVWQYTASFLPEARQAIIHIGEFVEKVFTDPTRLEKIPVNGQLVENS
jgi:monoterpene epsilon-lactone hydrolase